MCTSHPSFGRRPALGAGSVADLFVPCETDPKQQECQRPVRGYDGDVFFFSNRLGCLGSLFVSLVLTAVVLLLLTAIN